jgi:GAF domain-containing protein
MRPVVAEPHPQPLHQVVDYLQDLILKSNDVKVMLEELAAFSAATLADPATAFGSITLIQRKKPVTVASSNQGAVRLDETQYKAGDGPCLTAIREQTIIHVLDMGEDHRWPDYRAAARREGVGSSLSLPLALEGEADAGLNLYSTRSHGFAGQDIDMVQAYARHASKALRLAVRISQLADTKNHLIAALESRTVIDLAAGAIMAQNRCSQEAAVKILKLASSTRNMKLRDVAEIVVASLSGDRSIHTHFDA